MNPWKRGRIIVGGICVVAYFGGVFYFGGIKLVILFAAVAGATIGFLKFLFWAAGKEHEWDKKHPGGGS